MPDNKQKKIVDLYIRDQVKVERLAHSGRRDIDKELDALKRSLVALVANDYTPDGGRVNLAMIKKADALIDESFDKISDIVEANQLDVGQLQLDRFEEVLSVIMD